MNFKKQTPADNQFIKEHVLLQMEQIVTVIDKQGRVKFVNKPWGKLVKEAIIGQSIFRYLSGDSKKIVEAAIEDAFQGGSGEYIVESLSLTQKPAIYKTIYSPLKEKKKITGVILSSIDITEVYHQEQELVELRQKHEDILGELYDGVFVADRLGKFTYVNKAFADIHGEDSPEEIVGKSIFTYLTNDSKSIVEKHFFQALKGIDLPEKIVLKVNNKKLGTRIIELHTKIIRENGVPKRAQGVVRDVTKRLSTENSLNLFFKAFQTSPNSELLVSYKNGEPKIEWVNEAFEEYYGYSAEEVIGQNPSIVSSDKTDHSVYSNLWKDVLDPKKGTWRGEIINQKKNGEIIEVILSISTYFTKKGKPYYFFASHVDITQQKRIEERLELLQFAMDHASIPVYMVKKDASFFYVNQAAQLATGYTQEEFEHIDTFDLHKNLDQKVWDSLWNQASQEQVISTETEHMRKDGTVFPVELSINRIVFQEVEYNLVFSVNIADRKAREKQAEEVNRMKTEFVSLASHQLRTPLTAIRWGIEMIQSEVMTIDNQKLQGMLDDVHASSKRMIKLVSGLLNVSRIETGRLKVEPENLDVTKLVKSVVDETLPIASAKNVGIEYTFEKVKKIPIDPILVRQIILNLISNAVKYSPPGKKPVEVSVYMDEQNRQVIRVKDYGIGIKKDEQGRVFEKFFRSQNAIAQETDGNGLGLYIAKLIVEQVGGDIWFESALNKGSTFYLALPPKGMKQKEGEKALDVLKA